MDAIRLNWRGGEHDFRLRLGELRSLQTNLDSGPEEILNRLRIGNWRIDDLIEVIRLGLIGGGMEAKTSGPLVARIIESEPLSEFKLTALAILAHSLLGVDGDPVGEPEGAQAPPENGNSAGSMETAQ